MDLQLKRAGMDEKLIAQGTGDHVVAVYPDRVELVGGRKNRSAFSASFKEVTAVSIKGLINCTLTLELRDGRRLNVEGMALPDVRRVKAAIERQKKIATFVSSPSSSSDT